MMLLRRNWYSNLIKCGKITAFLNSSGDQQTYWIISLLFKSYRMLRTCWNNWLVSNSLLKIIKVASYNQSLNRKVKKKIVMLY